MATHPVEVVRLAKIDPHPNADRMEIAAVRGWSCCVGKGQFRPGDLAAFIEPDSLVDVARPEFAFLAPKAVPGKYGGMARIKVIRLRGMISQGLLLPAHPGWTEGQDVAAELGVVHYDPPIPLSSGGEAEAPPPGYRPAYDVESFYRFDRLFAAGEPVVATEKIHGASMRTCWAEGRLRCGSRTEWKQEDANNLWWRAARACPWIKEFCRAHPELTLYGEAYGRVQDLTYGLGPGEVRFAAFDLLGASGWLPWREARGLGAALVWVPVVYEGPFDEAKLKALAEGPSLVPGANHLREGIVVRPEAERTDPAVGRVQLKFVSNGYLERA